MTTTPDDPQLFDVVAAPTADDHGEGVVSGNGAGMSPVSARRSDPVSSHTTVISLAKDTSTASLVLSAVMRLSKDDDGGFTDPVTDDDVWQSLEFHTSRRWQRNVIARCRGLIERDGWLRRMPDVEGPHGRPVISYVPTRRAVKWWTEERT